MCSKAIKFPVLTLDNRFYNLKVERFEFRMREDFRKTKHKRKINSQIFYSPSTSDFQ